MENALVGVRRLAGVLLIAALALVGGIAVASPVAATDRTVKGPQPVLQIGVTHPAVATLQARLHMPMVTGYFGPITEAYVKALQRAAKLKATGVVTPKTWRVVGKVRFSPPIIGPTRGGITQSPVLGTHPGLGRVAAPVRNFRVGGHAYYLYSGKLHSCRYTGRCIDLFATIGEPVYALADGVLHLSPYAARSFGNFVTINHNDGSQSVYAHLATITAAAGPVKAGTLIGTVGCSGTSGEPNGCVSSGSHLHFEWSGLTWNPGEYGQPPPFFSRWLA